MLSGHEEEKDVLLQFHEKEELGRNEKYGMEQLTWVEM
jgi:hypothetical protein